MNLLQGTLTKPLQTLQRIVSVVYSLYDQFTTDRAAGSVNGTAAEPMGGARTVVDTNSKLSISGSKLSFATGGVTNGNPGIWYPPITRTAGLVLILDIKVTSGAQTTTGLVPTNNGVVNGNSFYFANPVSLSFFENSVSSQVIAITVANTDYNLCVILRTSGAYYFIKGGIYTNWSLLYCTTLVNSSNMYPNISGYLLTVFTTDNIRIPVPTWLPTPLAYSTFSADGATTTEAGTPDNVADYNAPALAITSQVGTFAVASGKGSFSALFGGVGIMTIPTTSTTDVLHDVVGVRSAGDVGVVVRYVDANNYVRAVHNGTNIQLVKVVAGTPTTLINTAAAYSASAVLRVICYGTKFRVYYNNAFIGSEQTISDAALQVGVVGLYSSDTGNTFDGLTTFARGTSNEYATLDGF